MNGLPVTRSSNFRFVPAILGLFFRGKAGVIHTTELASELTACIGGACVCVCRILVDLRDRYRYRHIFL